MEKKQILIQLGLPVLKLIQHETGEHNDMVRRIYELVELHEEREHVSMKLQEHQRKMKKNFEKRAMKETSI